LYPASFGYGDWIVQQSAGWLRNSMEIALDKRRDRHLRLAAEAVASAILTGEPPARVRDVAIGILSDEGEAFAVGMVDRILLPFGRSH
jgi:hypothetical protein